MKPIKYLQSLGSAGVLSSGS